MNHTIMFTIYFCLLLGVFFDNRVEHIKFVDFCGKYRIPLLQYLCSSKCITGSWESREIDSNATPHLLSKVLLG